MASLFLFKDTKNNELYKFKMLIINCLNNILGQFHTLIITKIDEEPEWAVFMAIFGCF